MIAMRLLMACATFCASMFGCSTIVDPAPPPHVICFSGSDELIEIDHSKAPDALQYVGLEMVKHDGMKTARYEYKVRQPIKIVIMPR
jgi:hypothetical protein